MEVVYISGGIIVVLIGGYVWYKIGQVKREKDFQEKLQQLPESDRQSVINQKQNKNNWGCLTAFFVLAIFGNALLAAMTFGAASQNTSFSVFGGFLNLTAAIFAVIVLWKRKKWAVFGYGAIIGLIMIINLSVGGLGAAASGILPLILLSTAVRPVWDQLE